MKLADEIRIDAPRDRVWAALNDVEVLKASIPGCEELTKDSDTALSAIVQAKVGPVKAKFKGAVTLSDLNPPESYRISGEGKGGAAGFAKGGALVTLVADGEQTILKYEVDADVGGKLAQIGARLIEGTSQKLAKEFFENFEKAVNAGSGASVAPATESVAAPAAEAEAVAPTAAEQQAGAQPAKKGMPTWVWLAVVAVLGGVIAFNFLH